MFVYFYLSFWCPLDDSLINFLYNTRSNTNYRIYANRMQAKKIITILILAWFSVTVVTLYIKMCYEKS